MERIVDVFGTNKIVKKTKSKIRLTLHSKMFGKIVVLDCKKYMIPVEEEYGTYIDCFLVDGTIKNYDCTYWEIIKEEIIEEF